MDAKELEMLKRAKIYMDYMANGIDPITKNEMNVDDTCNQVKVSRCLFYISSVLDRLIQNDGALEKVKVKEKKAYKEEFSITQDQLVNIQIKETDVYMSTILASINEAVVVEGMKKLQRQPIISWLTMNGYLEETVNELGRNTTFPTVKGNEIGIHLEARTDKNGVLYHGTVYSSSAQHFVILHLLEMLSAYKQNNQ